MPTQEWLRGVLGGAILTACKDDETLLRRDASERSIVFRVGRYLAPVVEECWPGRMWVDFEYNRMAGPEGMREAKRVAAPASTPDDRCLVLPDLIVHDRNVSSAWHNVLVVEAKKKCTVRGDDRECDLWKLATYKRDIDYQHAVYVELSDEPRWQWIDVDDELGPVKSPLTAPSPVRECASGA